MPSLSELREFKASFDNIGGQRIDLISKGIPFNDTRFPVNEPEPPPGESQPDAGDAGDASDGFDQDMPPLPGPGDDLPPDVNPLDDMNFGAFLDTQFDDLPIPPVDDAGPSAPAPSGGPALSGEPAPSGEPASSGEAALPDKPEPSDEPTADELFFPEDLLSAFPDDVDTNLDDPVLSETPDSDLSFDVDNFDNLGIPDNAAPEGGDIGLDSLGDLDFSPDPFAADTAVGSEDLGLDSLGDFDLAQEPSAAAGSADFDLDSLGDLDLTQEPSAAGSEDFDLDSLGDLDLTQDSSAAAASEDFDLDSLGDLDLAQDSSAAGSEDLDLDSLGDLDLAQDASAAGSEDLDLDSLGDLDLAQDSSAAGGGEDFDLDSLGDLDLAQDSSAAGGGEDFDLDRLGDLDLAQDASAAGGGEDFDLDSLGDLDLAQDSSAAGGGEDFDLDSLGDLDLAQGASDAGGGEDLDLDSLGDLDLTQDSSAAGSEDFDLDSLGDLDLAQDSSAAGGGEDFDLDSLGDLDLAQGASDAGGSEDFDLDSLGDLDLAQGASDAGSGEDFDLDSLGDLTQDASAIGGGEDFDLDSLGDLAQDAPAADSGSPPAGKSADGSEGKAGDSPAAIDSIDDIDLTGDLGSDDSHIVIDGFENFNVGADAGANEGFSLEDAGMEEFSFPGLDNILDDTPPAVKPGTKFADKAKSRLFGKSKTTPPTPEEIEEIQLTVEEMEYLQETLSSYPLNLRIACEELIAEEIVSPQQMSKLIHYLIRGATARETALLAGEILGRSIPIPKGFEKSSGEKLEADQSSFAYIFIHKFLPIMRLFLIIAVMAASLFYLIYRFIYIPQKAESIYKIGHERIIAGDYQRANERFSQAFGLHRKKNWFYTYAEAFRDERQYMHAAQKYDELLRYYPRDKKGVLDYAAFETHYRRDYEKAETLLQRQLLDYAPNDPEGLLAAGDNHLEWGDYINDQHQRGIGEADLSKYDDAQYYYARLRNLYGWTPPIIERMMRYFIRTDNLGEVLTLRNWFEANPKKRPLSAESYAELGGYLLDKLLEEKRGVPNEYVNSIDGIRDLLLRAVMANIDLPESHYHLARYYHSLGNSHEERVALEVAVYAFDHDTRAEKIKRLNYRIDTHRMLAGVLIEDMEFMEAEDQLIKGINLYNDALSRRFISRSPEFGRLYSMLGDLEYFVKDGDMEAALRYYHRSQQDGWAPPEMKYRMGQAYYELEDWGNALQYLFAASSELPWNRRVLFAMGNAAFKRGDYFAAQGYYSRLLTLLESHRSRLPMLLPNDRPEYLELAERLMMARNNAGVTCEMLAAQTGDRSYLNRALAYYTDATLAWDSRTRDPVNMIRSGSTPLPFLNSRNALYPQNDYVPQIFIRIDRDALEDSPWEKLAHLSQINN